MKTLLAGLLTLLFLLPASVAVGQAADPIRVGVRPDVAPFVWKDPASNHFRGFFWDICTMALTRLKKRREEVELNARQRADLLNTGSFCPKDKDCEARPEARETVDLLCDPTTITLARMENFANTVDGAGRFVFSPILFLENGSYVEQKSRARSVLTDTGAKHLCVDDAFKPVDGLCVRAPDKTSPWWRRVMVSGDDATAELGLDESPKPFDWKNACQQITASLFHPPSGAKALVSNGGNTAPADPLPPKMWPKPDPKAPEVQVWGYLTGATIENTVEATAERAREGAAKLRGEAAKNQIGVCTHAFESHTEAATAFCTGKIHRYFGDVELVRAALDHHRSTKDVDCPANEKPSSQGTYEPYALVLSQDPAGFPEAFTLAIYSMFTDGTIAQMFKGRFGEDRRQSDYLSTLFRINSIPDGR